MLREKVGGEERGVLREKVGGEERWVLREKVCSVEHRGFRRRAEHLMDLPSIAERGMGGLRGFSEAPPFAKRVLFPLAAIAASFPLSPFPCPGRAMSSIVRLGKTHHLWRHAITLLLTVFAGDCRHGSVNP